MSGWRERGDTIVEVLIAVAIISFVLVGAYTVTSKTVLALQNTAERVQAQHLVESQLESLKANNGLVGGTCFTSGGTPTSAGGCVQTAVGSGAAYQLTIVGSPNDYKATATWNGLGSNSTNNVTMYYRLK